MHAVGLSVDPPSYSHYEPGSSLYGDSDLYYDNLLDPYGWSYNEYHPVSSSKLNANAPEFVLPQEASVSNEDTGEELSREEAGTTGAIVEEKRVCWFGISDGTMYSGVLAPGYA